MVEIILFRFGTQHVFHVKWLSAFKPFGVIGIDWEACWRMNLLMNLLGPCTNMRERTTLVEGPAVDVVSVM